MSPFENLYEQNKLKWAKEDCQTARYAYQVMYNVPRVPIDRTEELTDYEFEFELILRQEYELYLKDLRSRNPIDPDSRGIDRDMRTDPEIFEMYKRKIEAGEPIDIQLPDTSNVPRLSQLRSAKEEKLEQHEFEPVNPEDVFGKLFGGGK